MRLRPWAVLLLATLLGLGYRSAVEVGLIQQQAPRLAAEPELYPRSETDALDLKSKYSHLVPLVPYAKDSARSDGYRTLCGDRLRGAMIAKSSRALTPQELSSFVGDYIRSNHFVQLMNHHTSFKRESSSISGKELTTSLVSVVSFHPCTSLEVTYKIVTYHFRHSLSTLEIWCDAEPEKT